MLSIYKREFVTEMPLAFVLTLANGNFDFAKGDDVAESRNIGGSTYDANVCCLSCKWLFVIDPYLVIGILYIYLGLEKMLRYLFFVFIENMK